MYELYAVQAAPDPDSARLTFEREDGEAEWLRLAQHPTADAALAALAQAHADRTTRPSYADPAVRPPLWGHELYRQADAGRGQCIGRADRTGLTVTDEFASAAGADTSIRVDQCPVLEPRWR